MADSTAECSLRSRTNSGSDSRAWSACERRPFLGNTTHSKRSFSACWLLGLWKPLSILMARSVEYRCLI
ncbi:MAG: hypothetical protein KZQ66_04415, partial [Candidatus Thiodiazotropha sp. (ex Lucinoma aequizonata)]|nr:hypothetical protein [Candidatus Thiodiazotropha sp. (ex Lucinoma aequizonata)]